MCGGSASGLQVVVLMVECKQPILSNPYCTSALHGYVLKWHVHLWQTLQLLLLVEPLAALEQMAGMSVCRWRGYALGSVLGIPPLTTDDSWNLSM